MKKIKPGKEALFRFYADSLVRLYAMRGEAEAHAILQGTEDAEIASISLTCTEVIAMLQELVEEQPADK